MAKARLFPCDRCRAEHEIVDLEVRHFGREVIAGIERPLISKLCKGCASQYIGWSRSPSATAQEGESNG